MASMDQIGKTATKTFTDAQGFTNVKYHETAVVRFDLKTIVLNTGGWKTSTTKLRMNQASNQFDLGFKVIQTDFTWFIHTRIVLLKKCFEWRDVTRPIIIDRETGEVKYKHDLTI